jgi:hypothetical protein
MATIIIIKTMMMMKASLVFLRKILVFSVTIVIVKVTEIDKPTPVAVPIVGALGVCNGKYDAVNMAA